jgi:peptidyl-prolyl cis-trans isomerase C
VHCAAGTRSYLLTFAKHLLGGAAIAAMMAGMAVAQEAAPAEEPTTDAPAETPAESPAEAPAETVPVTADTVVASVNGIDITLGHMIVMLARLPEQYQQLPDDVLFPGILEQLIQQASLAGDMNGELSKGSLLALENERRSFLAGEAMRVITENAVSDDALNALYTERYANAEPSQEFNAAHILLETEDEAKEVKAEIDGGADFAAVAQERSTGPSGPNGGDLGWFETGMMVEPFEEAVLALEPGQVSDPVQTQFGWHIIKLNETRLKEAPPLDAVRADLEAELQQKAVDDALATAAESAEITRNDEGIDPASLRNLDLLDE